MRIILYIFAICVLSSCLQRLYSPPKQDYEAMVHSIDKLFNEYDFNKFYNKDMANFTPDKVRAYQYLPDRELLSLCSYHAIPQHFEDFRKPDVGLGEQLLLLAMSKNIPSSYGLFANYLQNKKSLFCEKNEKNNLHKIFLYRLKSAKLKDVDVWYNLAIEDEKNGKYFNSIQYLANKVKHPDAIFKMFHMAYFNKNIEEAMFYYKKSLDSKSIDIFPFESERLFRKRKYKQAIYLATIYTKHKIESSSLQYSIVAHLHASRAGRRNLKYIKERFNR